MNVRLPRRDVAPPCLLRHTHSPVPFYDGTHARVNLSPTRPPVVASDLALWVGWTLMFAFGPAYFLQVVEGGR